jgi:hypothetical protein
MAWKTEEAEKKIAPSLLREEIKGLCHAQEL